MSLKKRIDELLCLHAEQTGRKKPSARGLSVDAGLSAGFLGALLTRLGEDPSTSIEHDSAVKLARAVKGARSAEWIRQGEERADDSGPVLAPFDEAARWARLNGAPEWAIERVRTRQARLARDRTPNDYWMMIQAAVAEGDDEAPAGHVVDEDDMPDPPAARRR